MKIVIICCRTTHLHLIWAMEDSVHNRIPGLIFEISRTICDYFIQGSARISWIIFQLLRTNNTKVKHILTIRTRNLTL